MVSRTEVEDGALLFEAWFFEGGTGGRRRDVVLHFDCATVRPSARVVLFVGCVAAPLVVCVCLCVLAFVITRDWNSARWCLIWVLGVVSAVIVHGVDRQ